MKNKFEIISTISLICIFISVLACLLFFLLGFMISSSLFKVGKTFLAIFILSNIVFFVSNELSNLIKRIEKIEKQLNINDKKEE